MDPIPAKQVKVEQPVVPPCELWVCAVLGDVTTFHPEGWYLENWQGEIQAKATAREFMDAGRHARLFHLSDAPIAAPLAVDAGVREGFADELQKLCRKWSPGTPTDDNAGMMADAALAYLRSQGWGPKGEE